LRQVALVAVVVTGLALLAGAARAEHVVVAIAPLSTLGAEDTSASTKKAIAQIEAAIAARPDTTIVTTAQVTAAIKKANKPALKVCEREPTCLAEIGKLVNANLVVSGEVGGLGEAKVIYLGVTDVATARDLRGTTFAVTGSDVAGGAAGAAIRLLDPDRYRGTVHFAIDVTGASVFINGDKRALSATGDIELPVGPQAVMVTHPQYHTFVRFVDVAFGKVTPVQVGMQQYPIVQHEVAGKPINLDKIVYVDPPLYKRWYVVAPAALLLLITTSIVAHEVTGGGLSVDHCRMLGGAGRRARSVARSRRRSSRRCSSS
jgi:hypothetical protein